jgi:hypothetical protein
VLFCVMCVICTLCLIVILLLPGKNPFAVKINNSKLDSSGLEQGSVVGSYEHSSEPLVFLKAR